ncbi:hypothetical protein Tco_1187504, partial [Tanacetum coccineum]
YKALVNKLVNDGIKLSKLEINTGFINGLPKKWLSFCQSLRNINHVKESELSSLFGKLKYEENLIDSIYDTKKKKSLTTATPFSIAFLSTSIVQDFQDSHDEEKDTRSSQEYLNDLEEEYQERALLAQNLTKANNDFAEKIHQSQAYAALISSGSLARMFDVNVGVDKECAELVNGKRILGLDQLTEDPSSSKQTDLVFVKSSMEDIKVSIPGIERPSFSKAVGFTLPNHDSCRILPAKSQVTITDPSVAITDSSATEYDSADESLVCSTPLPLLEKIDGVEPIQT